MSGIINKTLGQINFFKIGLKPMLRRKLKCKKLKWVRMYLDRHLNRIELSGWGEREGIFQMVECEPMKLTDHPDWEEAAMAEAKRHIPAHKQIDKCYISINFETAECKSEIFFVNLSDKKQKMTFDGKF